MISNDALKEYREYAKMLNESGDQSGEVVVALLNELERVREIHREEQRRSADRLRKALEDK